MAEFGLIRNEVAVLMDAVGNHQPAIFSALRNHFFPKSSGADFEEYVLESLSELRQMRVPIEQAIAVHNAADRQQRSKRLLKNVKLTPEARALAEESLRDILDSSDLPVHHKESLREMFARIAKSFFGQPNQRAGL